MIRWCLYLRHHSGNNLSTSVNAVIGHTKQAKHMRPSIRDSSCITLPSQRTLRDYTYYVKACTGFSNEVDKQLADAVKLEEREKCVVLIMDEMHLKENLVYDKHTGQAVEKMMAEIVILEVLQCTYLLCSFNRKYSCRLNILIMLNVVPLSLIC